MGGRKHSLILARHGLQVVTAIIRLVRRQMGRTVGR